MKVYFVYDGEGETPAQNMGAAKEREAYKVKITVPGSWLEGPCEKLLTFFCSTYNKKFGEEKAIVADEMLLKVGAVELPLSSTVQAHVQEYNDIMILHRKKPAAVEQHPEGSVVCTNYGCGCRFVPGVDVDPEACKHHAKGPVFHDTYKFWACCPDKKALDFDDFEKIEPCCVGPHGTTNKPPQFNANEPTAAPALNAEQVAAMEQQKQADAAVAACGAPRTGPREFEEALHAKKQRPPQEIKDGKATCRNFGCQQTFVVADNNDGACKYHVGGPVFHDTYRYWKCCPDKKCIDFDDFVAVPGCTTGAHQL